MPKLNVKQNNSNVIKAFQVALETGHRNLLDNPWWGSGEVVNQRGVTAKPSSNGAYCIDRWTWSSGADANNMSLGANGITFTRSASNIWFAQKMANPSALVGKKITGSVMLSDGTIKSGSVVYASVGSTPTLYQDSAIQIYISNVGAFSITIKTTQTIRAVKLELGSYSTLANDVPPDYGEELAKCQRYFLRLKKATYLNIAPGALAESSTNAYGLCYFPVPMRAIPTLTVSGSIVAFNGNSAQNIPVTILSVNSPATQQENPHCVSLRAQTAGGLTQGNRYDIQIRNDFNGYVDFSADL